MTILTNPDTVIRPDKSDLSIKRQQLMFDGRLLDDLEYAVYGRLQSQKAGNPRMTLDELHKQLWIWRCWRDCKGDYRAVAMKMREKGWGDATKVSVKYRIKRMHKLGLFDPHPALPRIA